METLLAIVLIIDVYVVIYYRLMVKHLYEQEHKVKETAFGAIFSLPPHSRLSATAKQYSRRYWIALGLLVMCIALLATTRNLSGLVS